MLVLCLPLPSQLNEHPQGGIMTRCPNHFNWFLSLQESTNQAQCPWPSPPFPLVSPDAQLIHVCNVNGLFPEVMIMSLLGLIQKPHLCRRLNNHFILPSIMKKTQGYINSFIQLFPTQRTQSTISPPEYNWPSSQLSHNQHQITLACVGDHGSEEPSSTISSTKNLRCKPEIDRPPLFGWA